MRTPAATAMTMIAQRGPGRGGGCGNGAEMPPRTAPDPARPTVPMHLWGIPQLTREPGDEVRNEPGYSRGAGRGWGAVGAQGVPHLPSLLAGSRQQGWLAHLWGWPLSPRPTAALPSSSEPGVCLGKDSE